MAGESQLRLLVLPERLPKRCGSVEYATGDSNGGGEDEKDTPLSRRAIAGAGWPGPVIFS